MSIPNTSTTSGKSSDIRRSGFTIVELLIVIVVIAILAAISVVAYNGIQDRAQTTRMGSELVTAAKKIELFRTINGIYPDSSAYKAQVDMQFSFPIAPPSVLLCASNANQNDGFAIVARDNNKSETTWYIYDSSGGGLSNQTYSGSTSAPDLCSNLASPHPAMLWGGHWATQI